MTTSDEITDPLITGLDVLKQIEINQRTSAREVWYKRREDKVRVLIRASIISVRNIDTVNQEFSVDVWLSAWYKEPLLKGKKDREEVDWDQLWDPRITLFNVVTVDKEEIAHELILRDGDDVPIVQIKRRIVATFKEPMELADFPFDYQKLTIQLMSDRPTQEIELTKNVATKDTIRTDPFIASHEWELMEFVEHKGKLTSTGQSTSSNVYPMYLITAYVKRKMGFYLWNISLMMFLIIALSFTVFAVPPDQPDDRLGVTLTLLLTSVAFKFVVSQNLPNIPYPTLLGKYVLMCLIFQCLMSVQCVLASILKRPWLFDIVAMTFFGSSVVIMHLVFGIYVWLTVRNTNDVLQEASRKYMRLGKAIDRAREERHKLGLNTDALGFTEEETAEVVLGMHNVENECETS